MATPIDVVVLKCCKIVLREIDETLHYSHDKKFGSLVNCRTQCLTGTHYFKFYSNRFTSGEVIVERVKAVLWSHE